MKTKFTKEELIEARHYAHMMTKYGWQVPDFKSDEDLIEWYRDCMAADLYI